jgi:hypothetical protein
MTLTEYPLREVVSRVPCPSPSAYDRETLSCGHWWNVYHSEAAVKRRRCHLCMPIPPKPEKRMTGQLTLLMEGES